MRIPAAAFAQMVFRYTVVLFGRGSNFRLRQTHRNCRFGFLKGRVSFCSGHQPAGSCLGCSLRCTTRDKVCVRNRRPLFVDGLSICHLLKKYESTSYPPRTLTAILFIDYSLSVLDYSRHSLHTIHKHLTGFSGQPGRCMAHGEGLFHIILRGLEQAFPTQNILSVGGRWTLSL